MAAARQGCADPLRSRRQSRGGGIRTGAARGIDPSRPDHSSLRMSLRVVDPGLHTLIVDFGRPRWRSLGVPVGGAADRFSLAIGNALVGNPPDAAALEITLAGPTLESDADLACVLYGAVVSLASDSQALVAGRTFTLHQDEELRIGAVTTGLRAYL